jgi:protein involved in polysaccharide export with SLBB domain
VLLHDGDVLTIRQLSGWKDLGASIKVDGEVAHPGTYGIQEGERLSSVIARAGGFRNDAYPYGAVFERVSVREMENRNRAELVERIRGERFQLKSTPPSSDPQEVLAREAALTQYEVTLEKLEKTPPEGRLVIHISSDVARWQNTPGDIQVRTGDSIYVPKKPNTVMVNGSVYIPTAVTFKPNKNAGWYLKQSGGPTVMAHKKGIFVVRADGSVAGGSGVESTQLRAGDMLVVPEKSPSIGNKWRTTLEIAQVATAIGIAIQVAKSF